MTRMSSTTTGTSVPVVVCISDTPEARSRLAEQFDGTGVLVIATNRASAAAFLSGVAVEEEATPAPTPGSPLLAGLQLDLTHHELTWHGRPLHLTPHELKVLTYLAGAPDRLRTYRQLHDHAWNHTYFPGPAAVQSVIKRLRTKLRQWELPLHIETTRGVGYRLTAADRGREVPRDVRS